MVVDYGWITRGWMMSFNGMVQKGMMEFGRGGTYVPARVAPQGRIHRLAALIMHDVQAYLGMETPLCGRSGGHTGTAPTIPLEQTPKNKLKRLLSLSKLQKIKLRLAQGWANGKKII